MKKSSLVLIISFFLAFFPFQNIEIPTDNQAGDQKAIKKLLLGKIDVRNHPDFSPISAPYTKKSNIYMNNEAHQAYIKMYNSAASQGVELNVVSAFRSFNHQKSIWEAKWTGQRRVLGQNLKEKYSNPVQRAQVILMFSSMPGTSRHHWGTDIDIYSLNDEDFLTGKGKIIYNWLISNAATFGFYQVYTPKPSTRSTGYEEEKWHWSYLPVAQKRLQQYANYISYNDIVGFKGDQVAKKINVIDNYVMGINEDCKKSIKKL